MFRIRYSEPARQDLLDIADYLESRVGKRNTKAWLKRIRSRARDLQHHALTYREREELGPGRRAVQVGPYMIFYRVIENSVIVQRILRGSRDLPRHLQNDT